MMDKLKKNMVFYLLLLIDFYLLPKRQQPEQKLTLMIHLAM